MDHPMECHNLWDAPSFHWLQPFPLYLGSSLLMPRDSRDAWNSGGFVRETVSIYSLFHLIAAIVVSLALGVLGPGAYSVDNKIFGRRLVILPHGSEGNSSDIEEVE